MKLGSKRFPRGRAVRNQRLRMPRAVMRVLRRRGGRVDLVLRATTRQRGKRAVTVTFRRRLKLGP